MKSAYERNKASYYRWIANNQDKYRANNKKQQAKKTARLTAWRRVSKIYRFILIDDVFDPCLEKSI